MCLKVHLWTLRNEDRFLAWDWQQDVLLAYDHFLALGADGFFTDFSLTLARYLDVLYPPERGGDVSDAPPRTHTTAPLVLLAAAGTLLVRSAHLV